MTAMSAEMNHQGWGSTRTQELNKQIQALTGRDLRLWSMGIVVVLLFAAGFLVVALPNLIWIPGGARIDAGHLVQLVVAVVVLILVFNGYVFEQKRAHQRTRQELIREIVFSERLQNFSLIDPLTQIFNRTYLDYILPKEVNRANRHGSTFTFLLVEVDGWKTVNKRWGEVVGDQLLIEAAQFLKTTFRGTDTILRYDTCRFLAIMPDTNEQQAGFALNRLLDRLDSWNLETKAPYEMAFKCGTASYSSGADITAVLEKAEHNVELNSCILTAAG